MPEQVFYRIQFCYEESKVMVKEPQQHRVGPFVTGISPWGLLDGASQGNPGKCGAGDCIFLDSTHFIFFSLGLGEGSNNWAELTALQHSSE